MKCKFCGEEMPQNGKFCPYCGRDNAEQEETEQLPDPANDESGAKAERKVKKARRVAAISGCIAAMAVLALVLFFGITGSRVDIGSWFDWELFRENNIMKQDSYTVSDAKAERKADTVVATLGDVTLSNSELQVYYQMEVLEFVSRYSYYLTSYFNLDYTQPLDEQDCPLMDGYTWQQYFLECALATWQQSQILTLEAQANGFRMDSEMQQYLDGLDQTMQQTATDSGYESLEAFFDSELGVNTDMEAYRSYMEVYYTSYLYFNSLYQNIEDLDEDALEAFYAENQEALKEKGIEKSDEYTIDVRHILIKCSGTENDDGTITFTDAEAASEAKAKAEQILADWLKNPTEAYFAELAKEHTEDSNGDDGGLYEDVAAGRMVATFNDWCFDQSRQSGDYGIVKSRFGYHIMFFSARNEEVWKSETRSYYLSMQAQQLIRQMVEKYEVQVNYGKIALAYVPLNGGSSTN